MITQKIKFYKSSSCTRCPIAKFILQRVLASKGLSYKSIVEERNVDNDRDAMADLLMYNAINTPLLVIGETVLKEEDALKERLVKEAINGWISKSGIQ
ncbi:MAG: glutaredoxin family protein [Candidatus Methanomethylicaceae archaeon]